MKKYSVIALIVIILALAYSGCMEAEGPAIKAAQLTDSEKELLSSVGVERYFVFDIDVAQIDFEKLEYRVDHYEKGELVGIISHGAVSGILSEEQKQRLIWSQIETGNEPEETWIISFAGARSTQRVVRDEVYSAMSWGQNEEVNSVNPGEEVMLAAIVATKDGSLLSPGAIFYSEKGDTDLLKDYDLAYVLSVVFQ
ncbi:hypothetical protein [Dethiobacter alkaliphilus]|uniref:hypothetical protein n=1 Tax=Dethiobacter alkaliphilus TaxID=427926 RepID=UPI002227DB7B|nr:hypothetical protein [Dethiobacter alkaliphilus]MCW3491619.1 hypothetical protein [Dethiobacter alkaliphilus]